PRTMQADRHQIVHDVVAAGHGVKDFGHLGGFLAFTHAAVAEMSSGVRVGTGRRRLFHDPLIVQHPPERRAWKTPWRHPDTRNSQTCNIPAIAWEARSLRCIGNS